MDELANKDNISPDNKDNSSPDNKDNSSSDQKENEKFTIMGFDGDTPQQSVFKIFGIELVAPEGMKNPGTIYILFVVVNIIIFVFIKSRL